MKPKTTRKESLIMDTVYHRIQNHYDDLSSTEQLVVDYILIMVIF